MNLKPVVFVQGKYAYNANNTTQQIMLLNALKITQDPKKLREIIGVKTVADVYRTLDKIAMRKEYHASLARKGITFDYIVDNVKNVIDSAEKDSDKLNGLKMLMASVGLDKYEESAINGGSWEDALLKINAETEAKGEKPKIVEYHVEEPKMPEHIRLAKEKANNEAKGLYE